MRGLSGAGEGCFAVDLLMGRLKEGIYHLVNGYVGVWAMVFEGLSSYHGARRGKVSVGDRGNLGAPWG